MNDYLPLLPLMVAFAVFAARRGLTYLHILQQEEYDSPRFFGWMLEHRVFDKRVTGALALITVLNFFLPFFLSALAIFALFLAAAWQEKDPRTASKKKLAMTQRAKRIFSSAIAAVLALALLLAVLVPTQTWQWIIAVQSIPFMLMLAVAALQPFENRIQKKFWDEAREKMQRLSPLVIGVTGSFGKTSVKHILGHILKTQAPTLITPGSVNTPMGIARIVREELGEHHRFFIAEMGAYGPGSIERLCQLTPPDMAIITAIGHAHYERFKSLDAVAQTKYELAQSVLTKNEGRVIAARDTLRFDAARQVWEKDSGRFVVVGAPGSESPPTDIKPALEILGAKQFPNGLEINLRWGADLYRIDVPLFGLHHAHNVALAFAAAVTLGIDPKAIITALQSVPQIEHRLQVKRQPDGTTIIDDAYNSNPQGFRAALELLSIISPEKRKILITPGMVEMGAAHDSEHLKIGQIAGRVCDVVIAVQPARIASFIEGVQQSGAGKILVRAQSFQEAMQWMNVNKQAGDVILLENDLPDLYEKIPQL